jgi:tetratricopeptide (TPR) repeat protein
MEKTEKTSQINSTSCIWVLFVIVIFAAYSNSFEASWQLDDKPNILKNPPIQLRQLFLTDLLQTAFAMPGSGGFYRPVACLSLALNWFFGQENVVGYHIINFFIHCCSAWFLFLVIKTLFFTPRLNGRYKPNQIEFMAVTAVLLWALNPIHVQAVTYIVQRMTSMAAMFSIAAVLLYLKARLNKAIIKRTFLLVSAVICYLLALLSKENAAAIILSLPVFEILFFQHTLSRSVIQKTVFGFVLACFVSVLAGLAMRPELFDFILNYYSNRPFTLTERVLTEQRILLHYVSQLFFPAPGRLSIEHDVILSTSFFKPWTTGGAIIANLLFVLLAIKSRHRLPFLSLAIFFFFLNHMVESTIVPLELVFEHRNYLPSLFLFLPLAQSFNWMLTKGQGNRFIIASIFGLLSFLLAVEGYATYERNKAWQTEESLWLDAMKKAPGSSRPLATLAIKLAWGPNPNESKYRKALKLTEQTLSMRMNRMQLDAAQLGNMASIYNKLGEYKSASDYYEKALAITPNDPGIRYNFSKNLIMAGNFSRARAELIAILDKGFVHADYFNMLGFIDLWIGNPGQALSAIQQAMKYSPLRPDILLTLGKCLSLMGYQDRAKWYFSLARKNGRNDAVVSLCIIENALRSDNIQQAQEELNRSFGLFSLSYFFQPLNFQSSDRYREVPLDNEILIPFLQSQLPGITEKFLLFKTK